MCSQDPIGFTVPVAQVFKLILQKTRALKVGWDKHSLEEMQADYKRWVEHLNSLELCTINRRLVLYESSAVSCK